MRRLTQEEFIDRVKKIHGEDAFDFSLTIYERFTKPVTLICKKHGIVSMWPQQVLKGSGCKFCALENRTTTKEQFLKLAKEKYGDKYEYDLTNFKKLSSIITVICKRHGSYNVQAGSHLDHECSSCYHEKQTSNTEEFIERANLIYGEDLFDYSLVKYENSDKHIIIKCKVCQKTFKRKPNAHLTRKLYCPHCSKHAKLTTEEFIKRSIETHDDRYSYEKSIYINTRTLITVTCKFHQDFTVNPYHFMKGSNCPICNSSKGELQIKKFLETNNINFIKEYKFDDCRNPKTNRILPFDFYLPDQNKILEFDGTHHFIDRFYHNTSLEIVQYKDSIKNKYCEDNNIKLIRIPYWEMKNIEKILSKELNIDL